MSYNPPRAGELRTIVKVLRPVDNKDNQRYRNPEYVNIYEDGRTLRCRWVSAFGQESLQAQSLGLTDPATLTFRYNPRITGACIVEKLVPGGKPIRYDIKAEPNDIHGLHRWMEVKVSRRRAAK